jgi:hypothetical protein
MKEKEEINQLNPLTVVDNVLKEASEWNLTAEVVLFALKVIKDNPELDPLTALFISRDEWDVASQMQAERTHEQETELTNPIDIENIQVSKAEQESLDADKLTEEDVKNIQNNKFSQHIGPDGHEDIFNE